MTAYYASISEDEQNYRENEADLKNDEMWINDWLGDPHPEDIVYEVDLDAIP